MVWSLLILGGVLLGFLGMILGIAVLCWSIRICLIIAKEFLEYIMA